MSNTLWALTTLNLILVSFALWAAITVRSHWKAFKRLLGARSTKSLAQLTTDIIELQSAFDAMSTTLKRLASRQGMRDLRERRREESTLAQLPVEPRARKEALKTALAKGQLTIVKDRPD